MGDRIVAGRGARAPWTASSGPFGARRLVPLAAVAALAGGAALAAAGAGASVEPPPAALFVQCLEDFEPLSFAALPGFEDPEWVLDEDGTVAVQQNNSQPTLLVADFPLDGRAIEVDLEVDTMGDGDVVGLALGIEPGDQVAFDARWWLVDWRRTEQSFDFPGGTAGGKAHVGLALSEVSGVPSADAFWAHQQLGSNGLVELARGATLGSTGWQPGESYTLHVDLEVDRLRLWVDGALELDVTGDFESALAGGRLGLFNFSQSGATYRVRAERVKGAWELYGDGTPGTLGVPSFALAEAPRVGQPLEFQMGNSLGLESDACLFLAGSAGEFETMLGTILFDLPFFTVFVLHPFDAEGGTKLVGVPADPSLAGAELFAQLTVADPGSATGYAWSRGMRILIGE